MMQTPLNEDTLLEIRKLSGLFFAPAEIAIMLGLNKADFCKEVKMVDSPAHDAFWAGRLQEEMKYRNKVISLANLGSPRHKP